MDTYQVIATVIALTLLLGLFNRRVLRLHPTIGMLLSGVLVGIGVWCLSRVNPDWAMAAGEWIDKLNFNDLVLKGLLGYLLFAGARQIDLARLKKRILSITVFALCGVLISVFAIGGMLWLLSGVFHLGLSFLECLLFGAIISPTDPIAVLAILKKIGGPETLTMDVEGESLFNDGIGVVVFTVILGIMASPEDVTVPKVVGLFALEAFGGLALGGAMGWFFSRLIHRNQDAPTQLLATLTIAAGGYQLANLLHVSGPLAMVMAGIIVGSHRSWSNADCKEHLDIFWGTVDEIGNSLLFMLVGLEFALVTYRALPELQVSVTAGLLAIPVVVIARYISLAIPFPLLKRRLPFMPGALTVMTWGGLRGGLPLAMALCIPAHHAADTHAAHIDRPVLVLMTYSVVLFSIVVQGLTITPLVRHYQRKG